ncbi:hypothetical protein ACFPVY_10310 [Flavobacterium qiangtangense]|uniref:Type II toxin-antitoxin system RelE/ParE family toxin n=1 Tax=Flavobacterium qiangtangense TaxID=1442595 RepID=A0ABW1PPG9_9FLAO
MVGKIEVIFTPSVISYLDDLVKILYKKEYFGFIESAEDYVFQIYDSVPENLKANNYKPSPKELKHFGSKYIFYKANSRTFWYIFFENKNEKYIITGILNSHSKDAKYL